MSDEKPSHKQLLYEEIACAITVLTIIGATAVALKVYEYWVQMQELINQ